jgi:hypothetical protein
MYEINGTILPNIACTTGSTTFYYTLSYDYTIVTSGTLTIDTSSSIAQVATSGGPVWLNGSQPITVNFYQGSGCTSGSATADFHLTVNRLH